MAEQVPDRAYHNVQQLSDAVVALENLKNKDSENAATFLVTQIQPLTSRIASLETAVADLAAQVKALKG